MEVNILQPTDKASTDMMINHPLAISKSQKRLEIWSRKDKGVLAGFSGNGSVMIFIRRPPTGEREWLFLSNNIHTLTSYVLGNFDRIGMQTTKNL